MTTESNSARIEGDAPPGAHTTSRPESGPFVINLCSSTTPMALRIPELPELKRFAFFVSRRREEGRERFRLHMGHFDTLAEAEEWLGVVRDLYPGAWAGEAPGKKLRAAQEATAQAAVTLAGTTAQAPALSSPPLIPPAPLARSAPPLPARVPPPAAAPRAAQSPPRKAPAKEGVTNAGAANPATGAAHRSHAAANASNAATGPMASWPPSGGGRPRRPERAAPTAHGRESSPPNTIPVVQAARLASAAASPAAPRPAASVPAPPVQPSNVRQVLADLDSTDDARPLPPSPPASGRPSLPPGTVARRVPPPVTAPVTESPAADPVDNPALSDTQVLRMLERRRDAAAKAPPAPVIGAPEDIQLLRPDDLSTMTELRHGLTANRQLFFAVQLEWSVQPIDLKRVPPLAIFSAYTLYTVEGNREGRKWYGLRVGFFADSISAKQVALYVRSEFKAVAVIPVSGREKTRATEDGRLSQSALGQAHHQEKPEEEFKLLDETGERPALAPQKLPPSPDAANTSVPAAKPASTGPAPKARPAGRPASRTERGRRLHEPRKRAREKTVEETLEETLEILGASQLSLDDGRTPFINETGVRHMSVTVDNNTGTFAKLLDRLSDRLIRGR